MITHVGYVMEQIKLRCLAILHIVNEFGMIPDVRKQSVDLFHILLNTEMQFEMNVAVVKRNVVVIAFPVGCKADLGQCIRGFVKVVLVNQNIYITTGPHPRFGVKRTDHRPFERNERNLYLAKCFPNALGRRGQLNLAIYRHHLRFFKGGTDLLVLRHKGEFGKRVRYQMRRIVFSGKAV